MNIIKYFIKKMRCNGGWVQFIPAIASAAGAIGSALLNKKSADDANQNAKQMADTAWDRTKEGYKNRYQYTTADMKKAGLNPILAASSGFNVGNSPQATPASTHMAQMPSATLDFPESAKDMAQAKTEQKKQALIGQQALTEIEKTAKTRAEKGLITEQERVALAKVWSLRADTQKAIEQGYQAHYQGQLNQEQAKNIDMQTKKMVMEMVQLGKVSAVYKSQIGTWLTYINEVRKTFGLNTSASGVGALTKMIK